MDELAMIGAVNLPVVCIGQLGELSKVNSLQAELQH